MVPGSMNGTKKMLQSEIDKTGERGENQDKKECVGTEQN